MKINLTTWAHDFARKRLGENFSKRAIDATAGNGHDTLFLAKLAGARGRIAAFDIQPEAISATRDRLDKNGFLENVELHLCAHQEMGNVLDASWRGNVCAVFFNLGYLPKSDHYVTTQAATTLSALDSAWALLAQEGFISLTIYTRHAGGFEESEQVDAWLGKMRSHAEVFTCGAHNPVEPWWAGIVKK